MLKSIVLGDEPSLSDKLAALPFSIAAAEPFHIADALGGSSGLVMAVGPLSADPIEKQPMILIVSNLWREPGLIAEAMTDILLSLQRMSFQAGKIEARTAAPFAGTEGYRLSGTYSIGGNTRRFKHYLAVNPEGRFIRLTVSAHEAEFDGLRTAIDASVAFKPAK